MGVNFELYSTATNTKELTAELAKHCLTVNWRECGGKGCYSLLQSLVGFDPDINYPDIDEQTMTEMYKCVLYFIEHKKRCDPLDYPKQVQESEFFNYLENRNQPIDTDDYTMKQSIRLSQWLHLGIKYNCTIVMY